MTTNQLHASLPRCPLIPDELLRKNNVYFEIDTRFRKASRILQALWLKDRNIKTGVHVRGEGDNAVVMPLHSNLDRDAARAGQNFLSPEIHKYVREQLLLREEGAAIDEERLFGNALSSMPMTFNIFAGLALNHELATSVFRGLFPSFVDKVEGFAFEHSPGRREERFLSDSTAFDLVVRVITPDGEPASIYIETKYSENMSGPAARLRDRYDEASRAVRLFVDPDAPILRSLAIEQLWREMMLAQLAVDQGITPKAMFVAIGPRLNRRVQAAFRVFENELIPEDDRDDNRVAFQAVTLEDFIAAIGSAGAEDLARDLWARYADFSRVYRLCLDDAFPQGLPSQEGSASSTAEAARKEMVRSLATRARASSKAR